MTSGRAKQGRYAAIVATADALSTSLLHFKHYRSPSALGSLMPQGDDDFDESDMVPRRLSSVAPLDATESEFDMCQAVIKSVRSALHECEEELQQAKRAFRMKVKSLEQEIQMLETASAKLREISRAKK